MTCPFLGIPQHLLSKEGLASPQKLYHWPCNLCSMKKLFLRERGAGELISKYALFARKHLLMASLAVFSQCDINLEEAGRISTRKVFVWQWR